MSHGNGTSVVAAVRQPKAAAIAGLAFGLILPHTDQINLDALDRIRRRDAREAGPRDPAEQDSDGQPEVGQLLDDI